MRIYLASASTTELHMAHEGAMKIYLASANSTELGEGHAGAIKLCHEEKKTHILLSYHYFKNIRLDALLEKHFIQPYPHIFLDSGAFSAFTQNEKISIEAYCEYINRYRQFITTYSNLDVIGSAQKTYENQLVMERACLSPIPAFHTGEDWKYLERYVEKYPYIALGGMVPYLGPGKRKTLVNWLLRCFRIAQGKAVFHGFGCTAWEIMKAFPWYSVDSSAWATSFRYGNIPLFDERRGRFCDVHIGDHKACFQVAHLFRRIGLDPGDFADRKRNARPKNCAAAASAYLLAEQWLERQHGPVGIPERNAV